MCLAIPAKVTKLLDEEKATVDVNGTFYDISTSFVEDVKIGDYLLVHVGYALSKIDKDEAKKTLDLIDQMNEAGAKEMESKS